MNIPRFRISAGTLVLAIMLALLLGCGGGGGGGGGTTGVSSGTNGNTTGNGNLNGSVVSDNGVQVNGIIIDFEDSSGNLVATATIQGGKFSANVPARATRFILQDSSIDRNLYYGEFGYNGLFYTTVGGSCTAPLPSLSGGGRVTLGTITVSSTQGPPPPPPTGCT